MRDVQFMTAKEKELTLKAWESFLKSGLAEEKFTNRLYDHLIQHCSFIAHFSRGGFYATYFENGDNTTHFLSQFDKRKATANGIPLSIEYGMTYWVTGDYEDINMAMIEVASKYIPALLNKANTAQKQSDIILAKQLLAKHGLAIEV